MDGTKASPVSSTLEGIMNTAPELIIARKAIAEIATRFPSLTMNCALCQANSGENVVFFVAIAKTCRNNLWAIAIPITLGGLPAACSR